jgi:phosphoglycolate phosphatase
VHEKKIILFDFDGTIADSLHRLLEISNVLAEEYGYRKVNKEEIPYFRNKSIMETFRELQIPLLKVPIIAHRVKTTFQREAHLSCLHEGMRETLAQLKNHYRLGILTSNTKNNVHRFLQQHQLELFDFVYTSSNIFGKSRVLRRILREQKLSVGEVIYVGDELRDIEAAQQLDMDIIAVSWGANNKKALAALSPTYLIDQPAKLISLLV